MSKGWDNVKTDPIKQVIGTGEDIIDTGKDIVSKSGEIIEIIGQPSNNYGQIPCVNDTDCLSLEQCADNSTVCICENGYCYG